MSALPIIDFHQNSFRIRTENFNSVLSKVGNRPFALISMNGATRTGKSYALNYFIRYLTSAESWPKVGNTPKFVAKSGRTRTTLGIDLWSEPFIMKVDGREIAVLLMDCQGLFDNQATGTQNAIIFSLSSLCSSMSVFNVMRNMDESIIQQIEFFSGYAHLISQENETENNLENEQEEESLFQRLIFLVRDFEFPGYEFGYHGDTRKGTSENNFFRDVFHSSAQADIPPENVFVREEILRSYKDVGCFLMPHPGRQFVRDETKPTDEEFEQFMKEFVELMLSPQNLVTKKIGGQEITGDDFKRFVEECGKLCEKAEDHFFAVQTIAESTATIQNTLAVNTALSHYEKAMSSFVQSYPRGLPDSEFLKLDEQLKLEALKIFNSIHKIGGKELTEEYRQSLIELTTKLCETNRQLNVSLVSKAATDDELEKNKQKVSEVQGKLSDLEIKSRREKEQQAKAIRDLQNKMAQDSTANAAQQRHYQNQLNVIQSNQRELAQAEEEEKKLLMAQLQAAEARFQESEKRHQKALENQMKTYQPFSPASTESVYDSEPAIRDKIESSLNFLCANTVHVAKFAMYLMHSKLMEESRFHELMNLEDNDFTVCYYLYEEVLQLDTLECLQNALAALNASGNDHIVKFILAKNDELNLILVSKAEMDKELQENKKKVSEVQRKLNDLEIQSRSDKEQQERVIRDFQNKMEQESAANAVQQRQYQEQLTVAQNQYSQLAQAAEENRRSLAVQIADSEARFQETERRHQQALQNQRRELANAQAAPRGKKKRWYKF